jgi:CRISPR-associated endonuclease/helicase Cas3
VTFYAHSLPDRPPEDWQPLEEHLKNVAELAATFAEPFGGQDWARLAGQWHDLGKFSEEFQKYLRTVSNPDPHIADSAARTDHSTAGAQQTATTINILGHLLAYIIAGHHSGLLNGRDDGACLEHRLGKSLEPWQHGLNQLPSMRPPQLPPFLQNSLARKDGFSIAFFTRLVFSCLVDADFLDTESFMDPERAGLRPNWPIDVLAQMETLLTYHVESFGPPITEVNRQRAAVRQDCLTAASRSPGLFSLTVPTGGGKTLASLAFALHHAKKYGLERVIYVIPFTSIIEQNAGEFRKVMQPLSEKFGQDVVIEHHSNFDPEQETTTTRLATENWNAPLVVTTSVQFYESLFANKTSRCRKLHRLAKSVIILDEVQTLPVDYLKPCLGALQELSTNYGTTVVLCTATQPAVHHRDDFSIGLKGVREIISEPKALYQKLKRVEVTDLGPQPDAEIAARVLAENQVLCVVNTRGHARALHEAIGQDEANYHLSALMCPAHRTEHLAEIRKRMDHDLPCRVISTQLIEAGVDIDFPVVFRSLAGLDSIAQAAGRCNRNGKLPHLGQTYVFQSEHQASERFFAETANSTAQVLALHDDALSLDAIEHFFKLYYWDKSAQWDSKLILQNFHLLNDLAFPFSFDFAKTAQDFKLIDNVQEPVIIPWDEEARDLCERLRYMKIPDRITLRKLQRYTVSLPRRKWLEHIDRTIERVHDQFPVLISPEMHYSDDFGLSLDEEKTGSYFS